MSAVYKLGKTTLELYVQEHSHFDAGALIASLNSGSFLGYQKSVGRGQSPYVASVPDTGGSGGCLPACLYYYSQLPIGLNLELTFSWDDSGEIKSANVTYTVNKGASFWEPDPPTASKMEVTQMQGGLGFHPAFMSTTIYGPSLTKLTNAELNALATEALRNQANPVFQAILAAIAEERKRRDDEARQKALQKPRCESGQCPPPPPPPAKSPT